MLNQRAIEILMELCNHLDKHLTANYFSEKFNVSLRTIQGDMHDIKNEFKNEICVDIISQTSKGSRIEIKNYEEFSILMNSLYQQCDVCEKKLKIISRFRYADGYICKECYKKASRQFTETITKKLYQKFKNYVSLTVI